MNMIKIRRIFILWLLVVTPFAFAEDEIQVKATKHYNVAIFENDIVAQKIFEILENKLGYQFTFQTYTDFPDIIGSVINKTSDLTPTIIYNKDRAKLFQISSPTNLLYMYYFSDSIPINQTKKIATANQAHFIGEFKKVFPNIEVVVYNNVDEGLELMRKGEIDGVIDTIVRMGYLLDKGLSAEALNDLMPIEPAGIAATFNVDKKELDLMASVLQTTESQKIIRETVEHYQFDKRQQIIRKEMTQKALDLSKPLKVKIENLPAFVQYNENGSVEGFIVDVLKQTCDVLGAKCEIVSKADEPWDEMYQDLKDNKIDLIAPLVITEDRQQHFYISQPFYKYDSVVVKRNNYKNNVYKRISELLIERIGVVRGDFHQTIVQKALPNKQLVEYDDLEGEVQGLLRKEVDYIILSQIDFNLLAKKSNNSMPIEIDESFAAPTIATEIAFGFSQTPENEELVALFNQALNTINLKKIENKYDIRPNWTLILKKQSQHEIISYGLFSAMLLIVLILIYIQYRRSITDELTKLLNRRAMYGTYKNGLTEDFKLIYLDLNSFKILNDTHGHKVGDKVLITFANKIKQHWKGHAYRVGGDEFILIGKCSKAEIQTLLDNIHQFSMYINKEPVKIYASFGTYESQKLTGLHDAIHQADIAMYENKNHFYNENRPDKDRRSR